MKKQKRSPYPTAKVDRNELVVDIDETCEVVIRCNCEEDHGRCGDGRVCSTQDKVRRVLTAAMLLEVL